MIKSFRGKLEHTQQERIRLSTKKGKIGYRIIKFELMGGNPGVGHQEGSVKIFKVRQSSVTSTIDFSDGNMLAAGYYQDHHEVSYPASLDVIFDKEIFNQDIYITNYSTDGSDHMNYYMELETMPLTDNAAAVSTLRDIRLTENTV